MKKLTLLTLAVATMLSLFIAKTALSQCKITVYIPTCCQAGTGFVTGVQGGATPENMLSSLIPQSNIKEPNKFYSIVGDALGGQGLCSGGKSCKLADLKNPEPPNNDYSVNTQEVANNSPIGVGVVDTDTSKPSCPITPKGMMSASGGSGLSYVCENICPLIKNK